MSHKSYIRLVLMKRLAPLPIRELRAQMEIKGLTLREVATRADVKYTVCSSVLSGYITAPDLLERIRAAIESAATPKDAIAA